MSPTQGQAVIIGAIQYQPFTFSRFANSDRWFAVPKGTAVWLATFVRCLWHPHCKRPNGILFANYPYLLPLASFTSWNQTIKARACSGGLKGQQSYSPRHRLGFYMPCGDFAPEGQKHFSPDGNAFALSGRLLLCYPCSPGCCPGLVAHCPFQGRFRQNDYCWWALQMSVLDTPGLQIWLNDYLSNNIRILTPKNRGYWSRKGHSVEKTPFFEVFGNALTDKWLHGYWFVI